MTRGVPDVIVGAEMPGPSVRIGRIAGIPVKVSASWLVVVALFTWILGSSYFPEVVKGVSPAESYALGLASVLLLFASILAHEFGHALVARRRGIEVEEIDLWLLGGVARMSGEAHDPDDELRYALAGPAVTAAIGACFGIAALLLPPGTPAGVRALVEYQAYVNAAILALNLLPAFPLDGGRVLRALLWRRTGQLRTATERAASIGRGFGYVMICLGGLALLGGAPSGLWLALIGFFITVAARQEAMGAEVKAALSGIDTQDLMSTPVVSIPERCSLARAGTDYFMPYRFNAFPVVDDAGRALGLITLAQLESKAPRDERAATVAQIADRDPQLTAAADEDVARLLERPAFARVGRAVVVDDAGKPIGMLSITDVQRALRVARLASPAQDERDHAAAR